MKGLNMNIDNIKMIKPNSAEHVKNINKDFTNIINGEIKLNTGLASLIVNLVNSKVFSIDCLKSVKGDEKNFTPKHFNDLAKIFVRDILEDNFKSFDSLCSIGLKFSSMYSLRFLSDSKVSKSLSVRFVNDVR